MNDEMHCSWYLSSVVPSVAKYGYLSNIADTIREQQLREQTEQNCLQYLMHPRTFEGRNLNFHDFH